MSIRLEGKWIYSGPNIGEATIELPDPEPEVGDMVLVKMKVTNVEKGYFDAIDGEGTEAPYNPIRDIVAVLPPEPIKSDCECKECVTENFPKIEPMPTDAGYMDIHLRLKINEIILAVNKLLKEEGR